MRETHPNVENEPVETESFLITDKTSQTLQVMKEVDFDIEEWIESSEDSEWVIKTLKLWFIFQKEFADVHWCSWPYIEEDVLFWNKAKDVLME